ncbi:uncharacterized protein LOC144621356 [Crassostrea virginica]
MTSYHNAKREHITGTAKYEKKTLDEKLMCLALMKHATNLDEKKLIQRNIQKRSIHIDLMYQAIEEKMERLEMDMLRHIQVHKKHQAKALLTQSILNSITEEFQ